MATTSVPLSLIPRISGCHSWDETNEAVRMINRTLRNKILTIVGILSHLCGKQKGLEKDKQVL